MDFWTLALHLFLGLKKVKDNGLSYKKRLKRN